MGRKPEERTIDGEVYTIAMLRPRISLSLLTRIFKIISTPIAKAFPEEVKLEEVMGVGISIGGAISELSERLSDRELQELIDILFTQVIHKGEGALSGTVAYDNLFTGRIKHLFKVVTASLEVQYADFLEGEDALAVIIKKSKQVANQELKEAQNKNRLMTQEPPI